MAALLAIARRVRDAGAVGFGPSLREHFCIARTAVEQPAFAVPERGCRAEGRVRQERADLGRDGRLGITASPSR